MKKAKHAIRFLTTVAVLIGIFVFGGKSVASTEVKGFDPTGLSVRYDVSIGNGDRTLLHIKIAIDRFDPQTMSLARWNRTNPPITNFVAKDGYGQTITHTKVQDWWAERWDFSDTTVSGFVVEYDVDLALTSQPDPTRDDESWYFSSELGVVMSQIIFLQPVYCELKPNSFPPIADIRVYFDIPSDWPVVTRMTNYGEYYAPNSLDYIENNHFGLGGYRFWLWGPIAFGDFQVTERIIGGVNIKVATFGWRNDISTQFAAEMFLIFDYGVQTLGATGENGLSFLWVLVDPQSISTSISIRYGGHELGNYGIMHSPYNHDVSCQDSYLEKSFGHLTFHHFFPHGPTYLPYYNRINITNSINEGLVEYWGIRSYSKTSLLDTCHLNTLWLERYLEYVGILNTPDDYPISEIDEHKGGPYVLWYYKVALVLNLLDYQISKSTGNQKSIDDVFSHLQKTYGEAVGFHKISLEEILETTNLVTGYDFTKFFNEYIDNVTPLPYKVTNSTLIIEDSSLPEIPRLAPEIDIKANDSDSLLSLTSGTPASITVSLDPGNLSTQNADWWVAQATPSGTFNYYNLSAGAMVPGLSVTHQGPLFNLGTTNLLNTSDLSVGPHTFYFGVDLKMNGLLDMDSIYYDWVTVNVTGP